MTDTLDRPWWEAYRRRLEQSFSQDEIVSALWPSRGSDSPKVARCTPGAKMLLNALFRYDHRCRNRRPAASRIRRAHIPARRRSVPGEGLCARGRQPGRLSGAAGPDHRRRAAHRNSRVATQSRISLPSCTAQARIPTLKRCARKSGQRPVRCSPYRACGRTRSSFKELGITSLAASEQAAREDRLKAVKGLGGALQAKILQNLAILRSGEGRRHMHRAALLLESHGGTQPAKGAP